MIQHGEGKEGTKPVTIVKCPCGHCETYGLSDGLFYQGCGWSRERAQQYADAINRADEERWNGRRCGNCGQAWAAHWTDSEGARYCSAEAGETFEETMAS